MAGRVVWPLYRDGELAGYVGWSPKHENFKLPNNLKAEEPEDDGKDGEEIHDAYTALIESS